MVNFLPIYAKVSTPSQNSTHMYIATPCIAIYSHKLFTNGISYLIIIWCLIFIDGLKKWPNIEMVLLVAMTK